MEIIKGILIGFSLFLIIVGTLAGTFMKNYYVRLHFISVADTVGGATLLITFGIFSSHHFAYLLLAAVVILQGPAITHLLARGAIHDKINVEEDRWHSHKR
ncbi:monovalent cation/H(+) antiporter subunit G [Mesoaciditoga lauensis]|uniref:monovalent cation/H(+) antiporter subunit G n=1 Tax=Mesoaciditoga lauensis TaxID=1495039 RepID=UPI00056D642F|nr:monovalent cation/H(+) antiporter subunit G [Mesoaciditoga lauensis]